LPDVVVAAADGVVSVTRLLVTGMGSLVDTVTGVTAIDVGIVVVDKFVVIMTGVSVIFVVVVVGGAVKIGILVVAGVDVFVVTAGGVIVFVIVCVYAVKLV